MDTSADHSGHRARLKRSLRENGLSAFASHEVIEMLLYTALPRRDVNSLAHRLDDAFGGIAGLFRSDIDTLMEKGGLSRNTAEFIYAMGECVRACAGDSAEAVTINTRTCADEFLREIAPQAMALLSKGHQVIFSSPIPKTEPEKFIFTRALIYDAASVIVRGAAFPGLKEKLRLTDTEYLEV